MSGVSLTIENIEAGWADLTIQLNDARYKLNGISYLEDSLDRLAHSGRSAIRGVPIDVIFEGEPEQWLLSVNPVENSSGIVNVSVHWSPGHRDFRPSDELKLSGDCDGRAYGRAVRDAFAPWRTSGDYYSKWRHPFPEHALKSLDRVLAS